MEDIVASIRICKGYVPIVSGVDGRWVRLELMLFGCDVTLMPIYLEE